MHYRHIYKLYHGQIPKDQDGRTYDIHHIDGDKTNNSILNLVALSIQDHYDVHYIQGDYGACYLISRKMKISSEDLSKLATMINKQMVENGTHSWIGERNPMVKRSKKGTHHLSGSNLSKKIIEKRNFSNSKKWKIIHPNGKEEIIINLIKYCQKMNLAERHMRSVAKGRRKHHKHFKCIGPFEQSDKI
jgi:hypothetical protein